MAVEDGTASPGRRNAARSAGRPGRYADDAVTASPGRSKVRALQQVEPSLEAQMMSPEPRIRARVVVRGLRVFFLNFPLSLGCSNLTVREPVKLYDFFCCVEQFVGLSWRLETDDERTTLCRARLAFDRKTARLVWDENRRRSGKAEAREMGVRGARVRRRRTAGKMVRAQRGEAV